MLRMNERTRRVRVMLAMLLLASLALVTIDFRTKGDGPLTKLGDAVAAVFGPLQDGISRITRPIGTFFAGFGRVGSLKAEIRRLQEELALLRRDQGRVLDAIRENDRLRALLGIKERLGLKTTAAEVIGRDPSNLEQSIVVDAGTRDGIRKDMPVVAGEGLVGRVVAVTSTTAKVRLIVDPRSQVAVRLAAGGETGVLAGNGRSDMVLDLLDPNAIVAAGDQVVTSGLTGLFPAGIPIGTVARADAAGGNLTRRAYVTPAVDFTALDFVLVVVGVGTPAAAAPSPAASPRPSPSPGASR